MSADRRKTFLFNTEWAKILQQFPPEIRLAIYDGLVEYISTGEEPVLPELARMGFAFIRRELDGVNAKYEARLAASRENGAKGGAPKGNKNAKKKVTETAEQVDENEKATENNPIQPKTTKNKGAKQPQKAEAEKVEILAPEDVEIVEAVEVSDNDEKTTSKKTDAQPLEVVEVVSTTKNNLKQPKTSETTLYDNMIYGDLIINIKSYSVVVDTREVDFLEEFFSQRHSYQLDVLCMQEHIDAPTLLAAAQEIIAEWKLRGEEKTDYKEAARHLINHLRRKFEAQRRQANAEAAAPKSRDKARADLINASRDRLATAIMNDGQPQRVNSAATDTEPF